MRLSASPSQTFRLIASLGLKIMMFSPRLTCKTIAFPVNPLLRIERSAISLLENVAKDESPFEKRDTWCKFFWQTQDKHRSHHQQPAIICWPNF